MARRARNNLAFGIALADRLARDGEGAAMGADVIAVLHDRETTAEIAKWAESKSLEVCGTEATLAHDGLVVENVGVK